jgi:hypothetical protein
MIVSEYTVPCLTYISWDSQKVQSVENGGRRRNPFALYSVSAHHGLSVGYISSAVHGYT